MNASVNSKTKPPFPWFYSSLAYGLTWVFWIPDFDPMARSFFLVDTLALGLECGYLMMKADNIWGTVLIHAASDVYLFIAVLANV